MKLLSILLAAFAVQGWAQTQPAASNLTPDTVIATIGGKKLTYAEVQSYLRGLPQQMQQSAMRSRKQFIEQYALMLRLSDMAEKAKLDEKSPYKESLAFNRMNILTQAQISQIYDNFPVSLEDEQKYYEANKSRYDQVKLKVIYIAFSAMDNKGATDEKKHLSEEEAKAKAEHLVEEIRGGADFVKLVKENSEDASSKGKDGDFGTFARTDNLPESVHNVVFSLKAGEVSAPVRQANGFYIFRAEEVSQKPFDQVSSQITSELRNAHLKEFLDSITKSLNIKFENEEFFTEGAKPAATAPPAK